MSSATAYEDVRRTTSVFDLFFDLPHPTASSGCERARMIEPPDKIETAGLAAMYEASNISRITRFAFPEHDDQKYAAALCYQRALKKASVYGKVDHLNRYDIYFDKFTSQTHSFSLQLSDGEAKLYGHVLRYLPPHCDAKARADVGRRGVRAMVLLTRAPGGDRFFRSVLKTVESAMMHGDAEAKVNNMQDLGRERATEFLHVLHRCHLRQYWDNLAKMKPSRGSSQVKLTDVFTDDSCLTIQAIEYAQAFRFRLRDKVLPGDFIQYQLPPSLQAGYRLGVAPDDSDAPILPIVRCLEAENTMRLLSALLCERRVILVSESVTRLSSCVRAATAILAQGMLAWQHLLIPVLPPQLFKYLTAQTPFLIGLLEEHFADVEKSLRLANVLCIHVDKNLMRTFRMEDPTKTIPDVLAQEKKSSKGNSEPSIAKILLHDIDQILKAERRAWGGNAETKISLDESVRSDDTPGMSTTISKRGNLFRRKLKPQNNGNDMAALFGKVMRGDSLHQTEGEFDGGLDDILSGTGHSSLDHDTNHSRRREAGTDARRVATLTVFDVCENKRGEEGMRAALASFFLVTHGDMGTLLSEDRSERAFLLDRRKYLRCKMREGADEGTPMFEIYKQFSGTSMLERHLQLRIEEYERGRCLLMTRHMSLFALCEKHLRLKRIAFTFANIRRVISTTVVSSPSHALVECSELIRARAMTLTSSQPFEGNVSQELNTLIGECHECDDALPQAMAVVWSRLDDQKGSGWMHPLLGLHLLKNLLLYGPVAAIAFAMDGITKVRKLQSYALAKNENNRDIQISANQVLEMMVDRPRLFLRRRHAMAIKSKLVDQKCSGIQCLRDVSINAGFRDYHMLLRPNNSFTTDFAKEAPQQGSLGRNETTQKRRPSNGNGSRLQSEANLSNHSMMRRASTALVPTEMKPVPGDITRSGNQNNARKSMEIKMGPTSQTSLGSNLVTRRRNMPSVPIEAKLASVHLQQRYSNQNGARQCMDKAMQHTNEAHSENYVAMERGSMSSVPIETKPAFGDVKLRSGNHSGSRQATEKARQHPNEPKMSSHVVTRREISSPIPIEKLSASGNSIQRSGARGSALRPRGETNLSNHTVMKKASNSAVPIERKPASNDVKKRSSPQIDTRKTMETNLGDNTSTSKADCSAFGMKPSPLPRRNSSL